MASPEDVDIAGNDVVGVQRTNRLQEWRVSFIKEDKVLCTVARFISKAEPIEAVSRETIVVRHRRRGWRFFANCGHLWSSTHDVLHWKVTVRTIDVHHLWNDWQIFDKFGQAIFHLDVSATCLFVPKQCEWLIYRGACGVVKPVIDVTYIAHCVGNLIDALGRNARNAVLIYDDTDCLRTSRVVIWFFSRL